MKSRILAAALLPFLMATPPHAQQQAQQPVLTGARVLAAGLARRRVVTAAPATSSL